MKKLGDLIKDNCQIESELDKTHIDEIQRQQIKAGVVKADEVNQQLEMTQEQLTKYLENLKDLQFGVRLTREEAKNIMPKRTRLLKEDNEFILFFNRFFYLEGQTTGKNYDTRPDQTRIIRDNIRQQYPDIINGIK